MEEQPRAGTDQELVEAAQAGSPAAMERLVERYLPIVYSIAYARLRHREAAEDLVQEVFLTAHLNVGSLKPPHLFGPWISRIARNAAFNWLDKGMRRSRLVAMVPLDEKAERLLAQKANGWHGQMEEKERTEAVQAAIFRLPLEQRELVLMRYIEGLSAAVIAERTGVHVKTVRRHLEKAVAQLKASVEAILSDAAPAIRAPRSTSARTLAILASAGALSAATKSTLTTATAAVAQQSLASLTAAGSASLSTKTLALLKSIPLLNKPAFEITAGGIVMTIKSLFIAACLIVLVLGAESYYSKLIKPVRAEADGSKEAARKILAGLAAIPGPTPVDCTVLYRRRTFALSQAEAGGNSQLMKDRFLNQKQRIRFDGSRVRYEALEDLGNPDDPKDAKAAIAAKEQRTGIYFHDATHPMVDLNVPEKNAAILNTPFYYPNPCALMHVKYKDFLGLGLGEISPSLKIEPDKTTIEVSADGRIIWRIVVKTGNPACLLSEELVYRNRGSKLDTITDSKTLSDFRNIDGRIIPFEIRIKDTRQEEVINVTDLTLNPVFSDDIFDFTKAAPAGTAVMDARKSPPVEYRIGSNR